MIDIFKTQNLNYTGRSTDLKEYTEKIKVNGIPYFRCPRTNEVVKRVKGQYIVCEGNKIPDVWRENKE